MLGLPFKMIKAIVEDKKVATVFNKDNTASVVQLCNVILAASDSMVTVSTMMKGEYGVEDVCLSTLALVGPNGCQGKVEVNLTDEEVELLHKSANTLKEVIAQIEI